MLNNVSSTIFSEAESISLVPLISGEWNHNLFNPPYITTAGDGLKILPIITSGTASDVTSGGKENFTTKSFSVDENTGTGYIEYTANGLFGESYKIVTYVKTNNSMPIYVNIYAEGNQTQFGSSQEEVSSLGWTKITTYIGSAGPDDTFSSFTYRIVANTISNIDIAPIVFFTVPEIYETTHFDYQNHSLWPTESPFINFRPGESYVTTGNSLCSMSSDYRKINTNFVNGSDDIFYAPISSIIQNPKTIFKNPSVPLLKHALPTNISPFKYFVSDWSFSNFSSRSISAVYEKDIYVNKLVLKFNTLVTIPTISISINGNPISVDDEGTSFAVCRAEDPNTGTLILYWTGDSWTRTKWSDMPEFTDSGNLTVYTSLNKITVSQVDQSVNTQFSDFAGENYAEDLTRMHLVEVSPRLEIDFSSFVENVSIDKSLDSKSSSLPISGINSNSANISLSGMPLLNGTEIVPIFSSQNNSYPTPLLNMLRKGIKFYIGYKLTNYSILSLGHTNNISSYIPGGVFYSDTWNETDISSVSIQCFDIIRQLQFVPAPDYVVNKVSGRNFEIVSSILDLVGFTDYDLDSLNTSLNNKAFPVDIYYYSVYSKDTTLVAALNELLTPYQIAAYIDEYGILKFLNLYDILSSQSNALYIADANIIQGGYSIANKTRPGKISIKYTQPKTKQSLSVQNVQDINIKNSPSFVYVTSNDILWEQQKTDGVGFNYVDEGINKEGTSLNTNVNDITDIFHTYNRDSNGYMLVEDEVISFDYKEYTISDNNSENIETVSIKNNLELQSAIDQFIKKYKPPLRDSSTAITDAIGNGSYVTYVAANSFKKDDYVLISDITPPGLNFSGKIRSATSSSFTVNSSVELTYESGGKAVINGGYGITISPTGNINNIKRGLFGTRPNEHKRITSLSSKNLSSMSLTSGFPDASQYLDIVDDHYGHSGYTADPFLPSISKIKCLENEHDIVIYPQDNLDIGYHTYSVKFDFPTTNQTSGGIVFDIPSNKSRRYSIMLRRINKMDPSTGLPYLVPNYSYYITVLDFENVLFWVDTTSICNKILKNLPKIIEKYYEYGKPKFKTHRDEFFNLQVAWKTSDGTDGEEGTEQNSKTILYVYLNGIQITGWQMPGTPYDPVTNPNGTGWIPLERNKITGLLKNPYLSNIPEDGTIFGFRTTSDFHYNWAPQSGIVLSSPSNTYTSCLREIHATEKPLLSRSTTYFYQDKEFLNGLLQEKPTALNSKSYIMQTTPEMRAINLYDVEYGTPAAVTAQHSVIQYMWNYYAGASVEEQNYMEKKLIDENSIAYSTLINSGHRGRIVLANNSSNMVYIKKEADSTNAFSINFTIWTNESIVPSDPELVEKVIDQSNMSEVVQMDTKWIQSKESAYKVMKIIELGLTGFSKDITLNIFGNPLIQVGDIVNLSYNLNGINQQKCVVSAVSQSFNNGLSTSLILNRIQE